MTILCTFPGRHGDILWALPTVRAISETFDQPVDLALANNYDSLSTLISQQSYIGTCFPVPTWHYNEDVEGSHRPSRIDGYERIINLGRTGWPTGPLAQYTWETAQRLVPDQPIAPLDLDRPWIEIAANTHYADHVAVGWSQEHLELKMGILAALVRRTYPNQTFYMLCPTFGGRWAEWDHNAEESSKLQFGYWDWLITAKILAGSRVFLGCQSALWVLANALGKTCVIMEPMEARWNPIFWCAHPRNHRVIGNDGKPTFDARAVGDMLEEVLGGLA